MPSLYPDFVLGQKCGLAGILWSYFSSAHLYFSTIFLAVSIILYSFGGPNVDIHPTPMNILNISESNSDQSESLEISLTRSADIKSASGKHIATKTWNWIVLSIKATSKRLNHSQNWSRIVRYLSLQKPSLSSFMIESGLAPASDSGQKIKAIFLPSSFLELALLPANFSSLWILF